MALSSRVGAESFPRPGVHSCGPSACRTWASGFAQPGFLLHKEPATPAPTPVEAISGACMLVKREAVEDVGLWDEGYFLHCEDLRC